MVGLGPVRQQKAPWQIWLLMRLMERLCLGQHPKQKLQAHCGQARRSLGELETELRYSSQSLLCLAVLVHNSCAGWTNHEVQSCQQQHAWCFAAAPDLLAVCCLPARLWLKPERTRKCLHHHSVHPCLVLCTHHHHDVVWRWIVLP